MAAKTPSLRPSRLIPMDEVSEADTERSPEPSPQVPPAPELFPSFEERNPTPQQNIDFGEDDESLASLPGAPSPYSDPPASLFSGEDPPKRTQSRRPPLREVRLSAASNLHHHQNDTFDSDRSLEQRMHRTLQQTPAQPPNLASSFSLLTPAANRSTLLPAVMTLKKDLQESHQSLYLLQEENKALATECDRMQTELDAWQSSSRDQDKAWKEQESKLEESLDRFRDQNHNLTLEKEELATQLETLDQTKQDLELAEQEKAHLEADLQALSKEKEQVSISLNQAQRELEAQAKHLKELETQVKTESNERCKTQEKLDALKLEIEALNIQLKKLSEDSAARLQQAKEDAVAKEQCLKQENSSYQLELDRLKAMLKEAEKRQTSEASEATTKVADLQKEMERLEAALQDLQTKNSGLLAEKVALRRKLVQQLRSRTDVGCQTDPEPKTTATSEAGIQTDAPVEATTIPYHTSVASGNSITDRLGRIRDAAERAQMEHKFRRELSRLKSEHEAELKQLQARHDGNLKKTVHDIKTEANTRSKDYRRRIQEEYESKILDLQQTHEAEMTKVRSS